MAYPTFWSIAVLTHGSPRLSIHTTTECIITPLLKQKSNQKKLIFGAQYKCNKNIVSTNKPKSEGKIHLDTVL